MDNQNSEIMQEQAQPTYLCTHTYFECVTFTSYKVLISCNSVLIMKVKLEPSSQLFSTGRPGLHQRSTV